MLKAVLFENTKPLFNRVKIIAFLSLVSLKARLVLWIRHYFSDPDQTFQMVSYQDSAPDPVSDST
jgi:hypothetical protein